MKKKNLLVGLAALATLGVACEPPIAIIGRDANTGQRTGFYTFALNPVPHNPAKDGGSDAHGIVAIEQHGNQVHVKILATGLAKGLPHAEHLHGVVIGGNTCPTLADDKDGNGLIDTAEGVPAYGSVQVSLTTSGDTSPASALAVDRFPVADANSAVVYDRTIQVSDELANNIEHLHVVLHGVDVNNNGKYDFDAGKSSLDPSLPLEATLPAACGGISG